MDKDWSDLIGQNGFGFGLICFGFGQIGCGFGQI